METETLSTNNSSDIIEQDNNTLYRDIEKISYSHTRHIAFIKTHKCASSTIQNILMRYGIRNNLTFVLPDSQINRLGWPRSFDPSLHVSKSIEKPDILCLHSVFSQKMVRYMPHDSFYLTTLRDPFQQILSSYTYFGVYQCTGHTLLEIFQLLHTNPKSMWYMCGAVAYNPMIYDLGLAFSLMGNKKVVNEYIEMLDKRFNLVMIVEYFDESLIILRDMLKWTNMEVLSFSINFRRRASDESPSQRPDGVDLVDTSENRAMVYNTLAADVALYKHFRNKLEKIISSNKEYIEAEKINLQKLREEWMSYCIEKSVPAYEIEDDRFRTWGNGAYGYILTPEGLENQTCIDLAMAEVPFVHRLNPNISESTSYN